ncbi:MAG: hypothetical protein OEQ13_10820 [Acidobacteriota bacterium]|nr:hypothetical protein [Acidobacteriota bacterium]
MKQMRFSSRILCAAATVAFVLGAGTTLVTATEPCGDFGECKALIEINSTDGDIGFHFLMDGDDLNSARIHDPSGVKVFQDQAKGPLRDQKLTETFAESAEPLCWDDLEADADEEIVTLEEFLDRWEDGTYVFTGMGDAGEKSEGETVLSYKLPAAPSGLVFDGSKISWSAGTDLGNCADFDRLADLVEDGVLPEHPMEVFVSRWEVVLEPDVDDDDPSKGLKFTIRVPGGIAPKEVTVPAEYLASLPDDTPVKIEVGAIGEDDNATFTELGDLCVNETAEGC